MNQPTHAQRPAVQRNIRVLYMGMLNIFSCAPLAALLAARIDVAGVIVPATRSEQLSQAAPLVQVIPEQSQLPLPIVNPYLTHNIVHIAWEQDIPVFQVSQLSSPETVEVFRVLQPDVACVACFPQCIPASLLALPPLGFLNVHPALLPAYRGPAPLFWAFRNDERTIGVTVHFMDQELDTGDIAMQAPIDLPDGTSSVEADRICSMLGARLLVEAVHRLQHGNLARRQQPPGGTHARWPMPEDFTISTTWTARRAFNFIRGTAAWGQPYLIEVDDGRLVVTSAVSFEADEVLPAPYIQIGSEVHIQFTPGVLRARID
jgi:methionyl-tRNA formyltransferase